VTTPVYEEGHAGDAHYLANGILISGNEIRVALQNTVPYTFGKVVGVSESTVGARSLVQLRGDLLPTALRHYVNAPGPTSTAAYPCAYDERYFQDLLATADTSCLGSETNSSLRIEPSAGLDYSSSNPNNDPSHHGPIVTLVGQGAQPSNM